MNNHYTYRVTWSDEDGQFIGSCAEFPSLSHLADSLPEAFLGIVDLVTFCVDDLRQEGSPVPEPLSTRHYSGHLSIRVPPETHRALAIEAAESGVSMNRLASERLALPR